ncbi:MAG: hypothetical protein ACOVRP_10865 [Gemmatimonas sp.]|jgi:hypothetical protein
MRFGCRAAPSTSRQFAPAIGRCSNLNKWQSDTLPLKEGALFRGTTGARHTNDLNARLERRDPRRPFSEQRHVPLGVLFRVRSHIASRWIDTSA